MHIKNKTIKKILFIVMWCFLIFFTACTSDDSDIQQKQTQAEQQPQQTETKKGMTEAEQEYFAQAQSDVQQMI